MGSRRPLGVLLVLAACAGGFLCAPALHSLTDCVHAASGAGQSTDGSTRGQLPDTGDCPICHHQSQGQLTAESANYPTGEPACRFVSPQVTTVVARAACSRYESRGPPFSSPIA
jgi:hypothetical protein